MAEELKSLLKGLIETINKSDKLMQLVKEWISTYDGKIIVFKTGSQSFHLVFSPQRVWMEDGDYPSPDLVLISENPQTIKQIILGKTQVKDVLRTGKLEIWGNLHEMYPLAKMMLESFKENPSLLK